jgi:hypothetical protein
LTSLNIGFIWRAEKGEIERRRRRLGAVDIGEDALKIEILISREENVLSRVRLFGAAGRVGRAAEHRRRGGVGHVDEAGEVLQVGRGGGRLLDHQRAAGAVGAVAGALRAAAGGAVGAAIVEIDGAEEDRLNLRLKDIEVEVAGGDAAGAARSARRCVGLGLRDPGEDGHRLGLRDDGRLTAGVQLGRL